MSNGEAMFYQVIALPLFRISLAHFSFIVDDFKTYNVCIDNCVYYEDSDTPTSVVIISQTNGSRTIIHSNRNLPELTLDDFKKLDLSQYSWIHFEVCSLTDSHRSYATNAKGHHWNFSFTILVVHNTTHFLIHINVILTYHSFPRSFLTKILKMFHVLPI